MQDNLSLYGNIKELNKKSILKIMLNFKRADCLFLNWYENILVENGRLSIIGALKLIFSFVVFRMLFKNFVFVRHNQYPHNCLERDALLVKRVIDFLEIIPHKVIVHSVTEIKKGRFYVPHPLYDNVNGFPENNGLKNYVIFGRITRYKKFEKVIERFPDNLKLIIAGKCDDMAYLDELNEMLKKHNNIEIIADFLSDHDARELIRNSKGLLITHNDSDMIVSGSFFYAMSLKSKVFCLTSPFFEWAEKELGSRYIDTYQSLEEMFLVLSNESRIAKKSIQFKKLPQDLFGDQVVLENLNKIINNI
jgi:glycosyltransferase involved in cell wall biosynthesis